MKEETLSTRLEPEIKQEFANRAIAEGLTPASCLKRLVLQYLKLEIEPLRASKVDDLEARISKLEALHKEELGTKEFLQQLGKYLKEESRK